MNAYENCYSTGSVTGSSDHVGGLIGRSISGSVTNSFSTGATTGSGDTVCGLIGGNSTSSSITDCYFYFYSGLDNGFGIALDDDQLQEQTSFIGFDFSGSTSDGTNDYWTIESGYMPRLTWQDSPGFEAPRIFDSIVTTLSGTGYANDPFVIATYADLIEFRTNTALRKGNYILANDIDLTGVTHTDAFVPEPFYGAFDGNDFAISDLAIEGTDYLGFFSELYGSVNNLTMNDVSITGSGDYVAGLVGWTSSYAAITNNSSTGIVAGNQYVGGLVASNHTAEISSCYSTASVTGSGLYVGGLCGENVIGIITNCYSTGSVNSSDNCVGGLVGYNSSNGNITNCYSSGAVTGDRVVGGLVGLNRGSITNCYSTGSVTGNFSVGGFVGDNREAFITSCYSTGLVTGVVAPARGLVYNNRRGRTNYSFWDTETSGTSDSYGGIGKTTLEMQTLSTFTDAGWDFTSTWWINDGRDYPRLYWQPFGDLNNDSHVNVVDFGVMSAAWGASDGDANYNSVCELSGDNTIDAADLSELTGMWMAGPF